MAQSDGEKWVSNHYLANKGVEYFNWQGGVGGGMGKIEARKFQRFISSGDDVLDFGCGGGYLLEALNCRSKAGVEVNPAAVRECQLRDLKVTDHIATVPNASFDVVLSNHSLEHTQSPFTSLKEIFRILRPNGKMVAHTPIDDWRSYRSYSESDIHHHLYTWTPQNFGNLLSDVGFKIERISLLTYCLPPYAAHLYPLLPEPLFDLVCRMWGTLIRYRQIETIASKPG